MKLTPMIHTATSTGPLTVSSNGFMSLDESLLTAPRQPNGDLPYIACLQLVSTSPMRDAGTNAGFAFAGAAPDLGAFEYGLEPAPILTMTQIESDLIFTATGGPAGGTNYLVAASDPLSPLEQWSRVRTNKFDTSGNVTFTNGLSPSEPALFHRLQLP